VIEVVCAVICREEKVLLCQRGTGAHLAGEWEFPGGKVEENEEPRMALVREIREELGCEVEVGEPLSAVEHCYPEIAIRLQPYRCVVSAREPLALEHEEIGWFDCEEVSALRLAEADRRIWNALKNER